MSSLCELDSKLVEVELAHEKAAVICNDLKEDYFGERDPEDWFLKCYYDASAIKAQILMDYLHETEAAIEALRELVNKEFEAAKSKVA